MCGALHLGNFTSKYGFFRSGTIYSMIKFLLICPTSALEKIFNPQNMLYIPPVKNCFRLEFEQIP